MTAEPAGFELLDHTADVLLLARGRDRGELFNQAGRGLMACIGNLGGEPARKPQRLELAADDLEHLFHDWLSELLYGFEARKQVFLGATFDRLQECVLSARVDWARVDPNVSQFWREVKAVTYHQLVVEQAEVGWRATVVLDI
jgi:SHS2 domain-containing protein